MSITVTGDTLQDIRYKLGIRGPASIEVFLGVSTRGGLRIIVKSITGPFTFFKVKQAATHIAGLLIAHEMKQITRERELSMKKRGVIPRKPRPNSRRRK